MFTTERAGVFVGVAFLVTLGMACSSSAKSTSSSTAAPATGAPIQPGPTEPPQSLTVNGQSLTIAVQDWHTVLSCTAAEQRTESACAGPLDRGTQLTLGIINQGSAAVTLPSVLLVAANYTGAGCTSANVNAAGSLNKDSDVLPGNSTTALYQFLLDGTPGSCMVTSVEVSVNASQGSGSITLPINDTVP